VQEHIVRIFLILLALLIGIAIGKWGLRSLPESGEQDPALSAESASFWRTPFELIRIRSSADSTSQPAYFYRAQGQTPRPLLVSLHTWSGDYTQEDTLAYLAKEQNWNYIHPDFRGPNRTVEACLSRKALRDIDDAIDYAIAQAPVDQGNLFIIGVSGGGYATLGAYMRSSHRMKAFSAWASISDLEAWYYESRIRKSKYADDIEGCLGGGKEFDAVSARTRSPLYWKTPDHSGARLDIYAGINDGYTGSVPVTHSLFFYNKVIRDQGCTNQERLVSDAAILSLLKYRKPPRPGDFGMIGERKIVYRNHLQNISVTIFEGGHEMLPEYAFQSLVTLAGEQVSSKQRVSVDARN